jgi:hypothetical protein
MTWFNLFKSFVLTVKKEDYLTLHGGISIMMKSRYGTEQEACVQERNITCIEILVG